MELNIMRAAVVTLGLSALVGGAMMEEPNAIMAAGGFIATVLGIGMTGK